MTWISRHDAIKQSMCRIQILGEAVTFAFEQIPLEMYESISYPLQLWADYRSLTLVGIHSGKGINLLSKPTIRRASKSACKKKKKAVVTPSVMK